MQKEILELIKIKDLKVDIFSESELTRMADLHFILLVLSTIEEEGYFTRDNQVEKYIAEFNNNYPNYEANKMLLSNVLIDILTSELKDDCIWFRKSNFYTIVCELCFTPKTIAEILPLLEEFETKILDNKNEDKQTNEFSLYYSNMYSGTNSRQARVIRSELFRKNIFT